jgi:hypothetical protein
MKRLTAVKTLGVGLVASLALLSAIVASGAFSAGSSGGPPFTEISNRGTAFTIPPALKQRMGLTGYSAIARLSTKSGEHYLRFAGGGPRDCFGNGQVDGELPVTVLKCSNGAPFFPSAKKPILDLSVVEVDAQGSARYVRVGGIAADGVAEIGVLNAAGNIAQTIPVTENVYDSSDIKRGTIASLVALDASGAVVGE